MDDLARQYWGRIKVARFVVMTRYFDVPSPAIRDRYDITYIPTVILFDRGVEVGRWQLVVMEAVYRYELDKYLKARAARDFERAMAPRAP